MKPSNKAYTLIELLVVISIIVLLIPLLLPALTAARATARQSACLSHIRQLGMLSAAYANDHEDRIQYVRMEDQSVAPAAVKNWIDFLDPYTPSSVTPWLQASQKIQAGVIPDAFSSCPKWRGYATWGPGPHLTGIWQDSRSYEQLRWDRTGAEQSSLKNSSGVVTRDRQFRLNEVKRPSAVIGWGDGRCRGLGRWSVRASGGVEQVTDPTRWNNKAAFIPYHADPERHQGSANYVFLDMHASPLPRELAFNGLMAYP